MKKITLLFTAITLLATVSLFSQTRDWSILQSWDIPGKASGLAYDGTYIYFGIYGSNGDHFYRFDPSSGTYQQQFVIPTIDDCYGMTWDGSSLWIINQASSPSDPAEATEIDLNGNILSTFQLPDHYMSGIAYDNGNFWVGTYYPDPGTIYEVTGSGTVLSQFTPPQDQIWDICMQSNDLWMVDYNADMIYKTDQSGNVLESHSSENIKPSGIVHDGTYIWYVDGQISTPSKLYKVSLTGPGTPEINIPVDNHNYGAVTINTSETWDMQVQNIGDTDLEITGINFPSGSPFSTTFNVPATISPGNSVSVPLVFSPTLQGHYDAIVEIESTDPITPVSEVFLMGDGVLSGPSLYVQENIHDYGDVRVNAYTRWYLVIENIGDETLIVSNIESNDEVFIIDESVEFPISIGTLDSALVGIWFNPIEESNYGGKLSIESNDPVNNPYFVNISGDGLLKNWLIGEALWNYVIDVSFDNSPKAISPISDVTGDDIDDVIICSEDYFIRCFNGNSSGTADIMWEYEVYSGTVYDQPALTIIDDINNDGYEDVIVGTTGGDRSIIAISGKTGEQIWKHQTNEYGLGGWVYAVSANFDYNGDGLNDVLAATGDDYEGLGPKRVYCLDAMDGLSIWENFVGGPVFGVIGVEDFTGDGQPDVIAGASNDPETEGRIIGIDGSNGNTEFDRPTDGSSVWALMQLDDITGDGVKDIAVGDFGGNYYFIDPVDNEVLFQGGINGSLILRFDKMNDVNGDGYSDILVAHSKANGIVINGYDGSNIWLKSLFDKSWNVAPIDDITGDDINDVIIGTLFSNNYCYYLNGVDGSEIHKLDYENPVDALNSIPDIVGDGTTEMLVGGRYGNVTCFSGGVDIWVGQQYQEAESMHELNVFPNPFTESINIDIKLSQDDYIECSVIDLSGKKVAIIGNGYYQKGQHSFYWTGHSTSSEELQQGFYILNIRTSNGNTSRRIAKL